MIPNARFIELLADIEPSPTTKGNASTAHTNLREHLRLHEKFKARWVRDFLAGSYARDTAIRPRSTSDGIERPDVDIIVVTNHTTSDRPEAVLKGVCRALEGEYTVERINKRSVRVATTHAEMDVVPVIEATGGFLIADRETDDWKLTNPPAHDRWSSEQNDIFEGRSKKLAKMLKWWRRENPTGKRPKGFVLEVLVARHAPSTETHFGEAFTQLLEAIDAAYSFRARMGSKPTISDPAVPGNDILAKVTLAQWRDFLEKVRVHAGYARRAQREEDVEEATCLWRKVFGNRFRSTPSAAKAASLAESAAAPAAGYTFPNTSAAPPTKPRGFA